MTAHQLAFVACRLFAVYWVLSYVLSQGGLIFVALEQAPDAVPMLISLAIAQLVSLSMAAGFWFAASPLSRGVTRNLPDIKANMPDDRQWQALILMALGAYGLFRSVLVVPDLILRTQQGTPPAVAGGALALLIIVSGILLLFPRKLADALNRINGTNK